jgi:predicted secreted protein
MRLRVLVAIAACLLMATTAIGATRLVITERDSGKTFTVRSGSELTLRLSSRYRWVEPKARGGAIRLVPVSYFTDPGFQEWEIRALHRGWTRITATGFDQTCDVAACAPRRFRVVVVVRRRHT